MQPNNNPTTDVPPSGNTTPLNLPLPKELDKTPLVEIAEVVGQAALEKSIKKDEATPVDQQTVQAIGTIVQTTGSMAANLAGAKPNDKPTELQTKDSKKKDLKKATSNPTVKVIVITGVVLLAIGLILMFFTKVSLGIIMIMIGAVAVISSVLLPIGAKK